MPPDRPRIALLTPGFSSSEDDWCIPALLDLVRILAREVDLTVIPLRYPHHRQPYRVYGARVIPIGGAEAAGLARMPILWRAVRTLQRESRERPFDGVHAFFTHEPGFVGAVFRRRTGTPLVVSVFGGELVHLPPIDYGGQRGLNRRLSALALAGADHVTVGSEFLRQIAAHDVPPERLSLRPFGVETERFHPNAPLDAPLAGHPRLLQVASLIPVKNLLALLSTLPRLQHHHPDVHLHLVGTGIDQPHLEAKARSLDVEAHLTLHGEVPHDQLPGFYRQADLLVQTSWFESQGMAVLEALACGCPVVGTAVGVLPELVPSEYLTSPTDHDPDVLAPLILRALREPPAAPQLPPRFHLASSAQSWLQLYSTLRQTR